MSEHDRPNVIVFPPVIVFATVAAAAALQFILPLGLLTRIDALWRLSGGRLAVLGGVAAAFAGAVTLMRHGTNVLPSRPATALITDGIYRWTRNPMYVGGAPAMIGIALFGLDWLPILMVLSWTVLHFGVVRREEAYLARKFGEAYSRYRAAVPRYVGIIQGARGFE